MANQTANVQIDIKGARALHHTRAFPKVLRGAKILRGMLCMAHDDRAMPAGPLDPAKAVADGGPLKIAGGSVNGDLYVYAKRPNVTFGIVNGVLGIAVSASTVAVSIVSGTTDAGAVIRLVQGHPLAAEMIGIWYGGNSTGTAGLLSATRIPYVRLIGESMFEIDNSQNASTDMDIPVDKAEFMCGLLYLLNDTNVPVDPKSWPGVGYVLDSQTITNVEGPYVLPVWVDEVSAYGKTAGMVCIKVD